MLFAKCIVYGTPQGQFFKGHLGKIKLNDIMLDWSKQAGHTYLSYICVCVYMNVYIHIYTYIYIMYIYIQKRPRNLDLLLQRRLGKRLNKQFLTAFRLRRGNSPAWHASFPRTSVTWAQ